MRASYHPYLDRKSVYGADHPSNYATMINFIKTLTLIRVVAKTIAAKTLHKYAINEY
jgi:hypothetical protein